MKIVLYALYVVVAVLAGKREDKAGSKEVVATAVSRSAAHRDGDGGVLHRAFV